MKRSVAALALLLLVAACGDDDAVTTTTAAPTTTATTVATTTTAAPTTTPATVPTTTTAATTTTTTLPPPVFGFFPDGLGVVDFGASPDAVLAALNPLLGTPSKDTGWINEPICPPPLYRLINYGSLPFDLTVIFTTAEYFAPAGTEQFFGYSYEGELTVPVDPPAITVGATLGDVQALYPGVSVQVHPLIDNAWEFTVTGDGNERLRGVLNGSGPGAVISELRGGGACGE